MRRCYYLILAKTIELGWNQFSEYSNKGHVLIILKMLFKMLRNFISIKFS